MAGKSSLFGWKPLWVIVLLVVLALGGLFAYDWMLGQDLAELKALPAAKAGPRLDEFLRDNGWSRHAAAAEALRDAKLVETIESKSEGEPEQALAFCEALLRRRIGGEASARCSQTLADLRIGVARRNVKRGKLGAALAELDALLQQGITGDARDAAQAERGKAKLELLLRSEDFPPAAELDAQVASILEDKPAPEVAGAAQDVATCAHLAAEAPAALDAAALQAILRCQALAAQHGSQGLGKAAADFVGRLEGSAISLALVAEPSAKLPQAEELRQALTASTTEWLRGQGRAVLAVPPESVGGALKPRYALHLRYSDAPGDKVHLPGAKKKKKGVLCGRARKVELEAELLDLQDRRWRGALRGKGAAPALAAGSAAEACEGLLVQAALDEVLGWLASQPGLLPEGPAAWPLREGGAAAPAPPPDEATQEPAPPAAEGAGADTPASDEAAETE